MSRINLNLSPVVAASVASAVTIGTSLIYAALRFPGPPKDNHGHSLAAVGPASTHWKVYPEEFYPGGAYVDLPAGRTRYWLFGPEDGKRVVLINGIMTPAIIWEHTALGLAKKGYRVLAYDLYGRGYSDAPDVEYNTALYTSQLALLMQHVGWSSACIAGVSMGGAIATAFAATFPWLISSVALLCPAGLMTATDLPVSMRFMSAPLVRVALDSGLMSAIKAQVVPNRPSNDPLVEVVTAQFAYLPRFTQVIASSIRHGPIRGLEGKYARLGELSKTKKTRVLVIWGTADDTVPFHYHRKVGEYIPDAQFFLIQDAPHDLSRTHPEEVTEALDAFFKDA